MAKSPEVYDKLAAFHEGKAKMHSETADRLRKEGK